MMGLFFQNANNIPAEELPGTRKKSFAISFAGGDIWCEHLDGMYGHKTAVIEKFKNDLPKIARPSSPSLIAVALEETEIDSELVLLIANTFADIDNFVRKIVFVGLDRFTKKQFQKAFRQRGSDVTFAVNYIDDFEKAKEWLIRDY